MYDNISFEVQGRVTLDAMYSNSSSLPAMAYLLELEDVLCGQRIKMEEVAVERQHERRYGTISVSVSE